MTVPPIALWVVPVADLGGVARHTLDALGSTIPGWRTVLTCPPGPLADAARAAGVAVLTAPLSPQDPLPAAVHSLRALVRTLRPAVVHSHLAYADLLATAATAGAGVALVSTEHGIAADDLIYHGSTAKSALRATVHHARMHRLSALIAVSRSTLEVIERKWRPPAGLPRHVVHNGVDPLPEPPARGAGLRIASLARLAPEKGLDDLVRAFAVLADDRADAQLTLAGEGPLAGPLRDLVAHLGLAGRVDFPGFVAADELLHRSDVIAQLSVWENCSYTLLDAQRYGLGVVATPVGGNVEMLPQHCLVDRLAPPQVAAALRAQGLEVALRPRLDPAWPTLSDMVEQVADVYAQVRR